MNDAHDVPLTFVSELGPAQKVTIIIETAERTVTAEFAGDEFETAARFQSTVTEPPDLSPPAGIWFPERQYHLDVALRRASIVRVTTEEA